MTDSRKGGTVEYVTSSGTRESVVAALRSEARTARELCAALDASESGVYAATNDLRERNLIETVDGRFRLTGLGLVVADAVERRRQLETLLAADPCYWQTHDVRALPDVFRARLGELADAEVFRASETDPGGAVRLIHEHLLDADAMSVVSPVHFPNLGRTLREVCADRPGRLLVTDAVVEEIRRHDAAVVPVPESLSIRVADVSFALAVVGEKTFLSLPRLDGTYDPSTELVADTAAAAAFGADLFDHVWADATPVEDVASTRSP
ncbi:transcriptional regulator [Halogeometricum pallidum JCM 14848]|uniref:Transcriptional regulator n=1 Tax=Halogeometricum pallidum JCM 14848 TaxID=1227487 RepID=M0CWU1_HALPD|nr:transcriptional regulator FilR1 domain-containing protein [Halogeometricum pallidum]ELZ27093.1 transcriptional regulator [Halogeometricum pallidum JCM 14848]